MQNDEMQITESGETIDETLGTPDVEAADQSAEEISIEELSLVCPGISDENADEYCNLERYRELKALGLTAEEAFAATARKRTHRDSRAHLSSSIGRGASIPRSGMSEQDLRAAREIFVGMSDAEIRQLYKKVI